MELGDTTYIYLTAIHKNKNKVVDKRKFRETNVQVSKQVTSFYSWYSFEQLKHLLKKIVRYSCRIYAYWKIKICIRFFS